MRSTTSSPSGPLNTSLKRSSFDVTNYLAELPAVDEGQMEGEALNQAEIDLRLELERLARAQGTEDRAYSPIMLVRETITPVTLWTRSVYPLKFADMASDTKVAEAQAVSEDGDESFAPEAGLRLRTE